MVGARGQHRKRAQLIRDDNWPWFFALLFGRRCCGCGVNDMGWCMPREYACNRSLIGRICLLQHHLPSARQPQICLESVVWSAAMEHDDIMPSLCEGDGYVRPNEPSGPGHQDSHHVLRSEVSATSFA